jgi:hypothetical protein
MISPIKYSKFVERYTTQRSSQVCGQASKAVRESPKSTSPTTSQRCETFLPTWAQLISLPSGRLPRHDVLSPVQPPVTGDPVTGAAVGVTQAALQESGQFSRAPGRSHCPSGLLLTPSQSIMRPSLGFVRDQVVLSTH